MPVKVEFTGETAAHVIADLSGFAAPFIQARHFAEAARAAQAAQKPTPETQQGGAEAGPAAGGDADRVAAVAPADGALVLSHPSAAPSVVGSIGEVTDTKTQVVAAVEPVAKPRGRPRRKGAAPTASEAIIQKFKVIYDDREEHFDDLTEAFEAMADHIEAASDPATIDAFMKANEWVGALDEKYAKMVEVLHGVVKQATADLAKPAAAAPAPGPTAAVNDDMPEFLRRDGEKGAASTDTKLFPTLATYNVEHARAALRAMAADTENAVLNSDQLRNGFLVKAMGATGATKISEIAADKLAGYVEGIVQALSPKAIEGLKEKWAEIK